MNPNANLLPARSGSFEEYEKNKSVLVLSPEQQGRLWCAKVSCAVLLFFSMAGALIVDLAIPQTFAFNAHVGAVFPSGPQTAPGTFPPSAIFPLGTADIGLAAAFVSVLAFLGFAFMSCFQAAEIDQLKTGMNPYMWIFLGLWLPVVTLVVSFEAGVIDPFAISLLFFLTWGYIWLWWADDKLHSYAYVQTETQAREASSSGSMLNDPTLWSWVFYAQALFLLVIQYIVIFVAVGFTFSKSGVSKTLIVGPVVIGIFVILGYAIIIGLHNNSGYLASAYAYTMTMYIYSGFIAVLATWLSIALNTVQ